MDLELKAVTFKCGNASIAYKLNSSIDWSITEKIIRKSFKISPTTEFQLVDLSDGKIIAGQLIPFLTNEAIIEVQFLIDSSFDEASSSIRSNESKPNILSFNDNSNDLQISDLSQSGSTSEAESTSSSSSLRYSSPVLPSGFAKQIEAQQRKKIRDAKIMASRKISHFLEKYCQVDPNQMKTVINKILTEQHFRITELYDLLKYARRKIDLKTLSQNQHDVFKWIEIVKLERQKSLVPSELNHLKLKTG